MTLTQNLSVVTNDAQGPQKYPYIPPEIAVGTDFHVQHRTKTITVFLPTNGEASW